MARLDGAEWAPAGTTPGGYMDPRVVIFHVTAGEGIAQPHSDLEWHFHVAYDGSVRQLVDTNRQAAANYKANPFAISIETEGLGDGEWTDAQLDSLVFISEWAMSKHPKIQRQRCPRWDGSGFGYHVMFGAPGPWTPVAKSCPGPRRIRQFDEVLLPRILQEDDMPSIEEVRAQMDAANNRVIGEIQNTLKSLLGVQPPQNLLGEVQSAVKYGATLVDLNEAEIAEVIAKNLTPASLARLGQDDLDAIAKATADELARRAQD